MTRPFAGAQGKPPLTFQGSPVAPIFRRTDGKAVLVYLDRFGQPSTHTTEAFAHELISRHWHLAEVKQLVALLPIHPLAAADPFAASAAAGVPPRVAFGAGGPSFIHRVAESLERKELP